MNLQNCLSCGRDTEYDLCPSCTQHGVVRLYDDRELDLSEGAEDFLEDMEEWRKEFGSGE